MYAIISPQSLKVIQYDPPNIKTFSLYLIFRSHQLTVASFQVSVFIPEPRTLELYLKSPI